MGRKRGRPRGKRPRARKDDDGAGQEPALFPVGAAVEVCSDEQGFAGSFYEATVAGYPPSGRGYVVEYATLTRRDDGGSPLREHAAAAHVRPRPPPAPASSAREFAVHEMVEAFHNEGWWAGVVCKVPPPAADDSGERVPPRRVYTVCFPTTGEVLEFEETRLRPHFVFLGERWVPAAEAENGSSILRTGGEVEVSGSAKTFGKYWNPATVQKVIGATTFLVQYRHVGENGELSSEILDSQYIRPARNIIRMDSKFRYPPSSHVEVFHEGSWWPGVILGVLDDKDIKKYVVEIMNRETDTDDVERVDVLIVEHTQLSQRYDWDGKKWLRTLTKKIVDRGPQFPSPKRPVSTALASSNDSNEISAFPSFHDNEVRDEPCCSVKEKENNADAVLVPVSPDLVVCNGNDKFEHKTSSYPEESTKKLNSVLALKAPLSLPSQLSVLGSGLKYDPKLFLSSQLLPLSTRMISMTSVPKSGQFEASLFGSFGQLRPLPQGPVLGIQSLNPDFGSIVGSKRAFSDLEKQSTDKGYDLMAGADHNLNGGSFGGTDLSRKRWKEAPDGLEETPKIMPTTKGIIDKNVEGTNKNLAVSEDSTKSQSNGDKEVPNDSINTMTSMGSTPLMNSKDSQESSIFLRESSAVDEIIPSGIPIEIDESHQGDSVGAIQHCATKVSLLSKTSVIKSTLDNSGDAYVSLSDSLAQFGNKATNAGKSAITIEQDISEQFGEQSVVMADDANVDLLPSVESSEATVNADHLGKDDMETVLECAISCSGPTKNMPSVSHGIFSSVVPDLLAPTENCEANKKDGMGKADHHETQHSSAYGSSSAISLHAPKGDTVMIESLTKKSAAGVQHGVSQQDLSSPMVESLPESSQSTDKSALTQLSSADMSNSTKAEHDNRLIEPKDADRTPMSKYVPSRTFDSCRPLMQRSLDVHKSILDDRPLESLAVENLPFVKTSPMWVQVEAMEIFREVPQRPNFHQFQQHVPELREGMALGLMLSFANLAESIKKLNIQDEDSLFEEKMKGLSSLEAHGFDVSRLRSHLETLLCIKNGRPELQDAIKKLEEKIVLEETENRQLGAQIGILNTTVCQLELHAYLLRCIMKSAVSQRINHSFEISRLKAEASELERSCMSAVERFTNAVAALW